MWFKSQFLENFKKATYITLMLSMVLMSLNIEIDTMVERLMKDQKIDVSIDKSVRLLVAEKGFDEKYGARPLKRAITQYIENEISNALINSDVSRNEKIKVSYDKKKETINVNGTDSKKGKN